MKVEQTPIIIQPNGGVPVQRPDNNNNSQDVKQAPPKATPTSTQVSRDFDEATGLLQSIVTDKISEKVIKKMPTDEYLKLLSLLDNIVNGSIDKRV